MPRQVTLEDGRIRYECDVCMWRFSREESAAICARLDRNVSPTNKHEEPEVLDVDFS
jgi:hypothetical protein